MTSDEAKYGTERIKNVLDLIDRFTVSVRPDPTIVWRGQTCSEWRLTPSLFRLKPKCKERSWGSIENALLREFEKANLRWVKEHHAEGFIERLTLAQHHRLPTRLLDWTESPLIALFFACADVLEPGDGATDGAVWRLHTSAVWFELGDEKQDRLELPDGSVEPGIPENTPKGLNEDFETFLFYPNRLHPRQISQLAAFTVHPNPKSSGDCSQTLHRKEKLLRYVIPKETKHECLAKLWSLGIRYETIFPDQEGAAKGAKYVIENEDGSLYTWSS